MQSRFWRLQIFADGGGDGGTASGGEGAAATGVNPADAGQGKQQTIRDRLRQMGVPEDKLNNRAYDAPASSGTPMQQERTADAAQTNDQEQSKKPTLKELLKSDPDYNAEAERMMSRRVAKFKGSSEAMETLAPALEMMAKHYGLDPEQMDYAALSNAMLEDDAFYQERALEMGVSVDVAKRLDRAEMLEAAHQREQQRTEAERQIHEHLASLYQQGEEMAAKYPGFNLDAELQNDTFARLTAPGSGLSVEDAFFAVHRQELLTAARQHAAQNISQSIAAGASRPNETGTRKAGINPDRNPNDIKNMPKERREELIRRAKAGERITVDMLYGG